MLRPLLIAEAVPGWRFKRQGDDFKSTIQAVPAFATF
jgi:hypothetical protein